MREQYQPTTSTRVALETHVSKDWGCARPPEGVGSIERAFDPVPKEPIQRQVMQSIEGEVDEWEAHTEFDLGVLISSYLQRNPPPPPGSRLAARLEKVGAGLQDHGRDRLAHLGRQPLRAVATSASSTER